MNGSSEKKAVAQYEWKNDPNLWVDAKLEVQALLTFTKNGQRAEVDIIDGKLTYSGDVEVTDAAKSLFEALVGWVDDWWLERAATKPTAGGK